MNELMAQLGSRAKDLTAVTAAVSAAAYAFGYLVLRARALMLGIEPTLDLVSGAYVFAGFRFLIVTGLYLVPVIGLTQPVGSAVDGWYPGWYGVAGVYLVVWLELAYVGTLRGTLLKPGASLQSSATRFAVSLSATALMYMVVAWLATVADGLARGEALPLALALVLALQLVAQALLHGAFFADQVGRQLARIPDGVEGLVGPVWLIDRGRERVSLFGRTEVGAPRVVSLAANKLDGIPFVGVEIGLKKLLAGSVTLAVAMSLLAMLQIGGVAMAQTPPPRSFGGFLGAAWSALKAVPEVIGSLGESGLDQGVVWEYRIADGTRRRLSRDGDLAFPVAGAGAVLAIQGDRVVQLDVEGQARPIAGPQAEWVKLIAVTGEGVLGLVGYDLPRAVLLTPEGRLEEFARPASEQERYKLAILKFESRQYAAGKLRLENAARGSGKDVHFVRPGEDINVSDAGPAGAGHPFLTGDGTRVLYIVGRD